MDEFELDGAHAEIERLAALHQSKKPVYGDRFLSHRTPGSEDFGAPPDTERTHEAVLADVAMVARDNGVSTARVRGLVLLTCARAGLGHSPDEEDAALGQVALSLQRGQAEVPADRILALSNLGAGDTADTIGLALPIPDAEHLKAAAVLSRAGHEDYPAAAVAQRASELGLPDPLASRQITASPDTMQLALAMADGDGCGDDVTLAGQTQESRALALSGAGQDSAEKAIARHPELSYLSRTSPRTSSRRHPRKPGRAGMLTTGTRAHSSDLDEDTRDTGQPGRGGAVHAEVRRYVEGNPDLFTDGEGREGARSGSRSYGPSPYKSPGPSGKPQVSRDRTPRRGPGTSGSVIA